MGSSAVVTVAAIAATVVTAGAAAPLAEAAILGETAIADAALGEIIAVGAATGAAGGIAGGVTGAALTGGDIGKAALKGGVTGGIGGGVSAGLFGLPESYLPEGATQPKPLLGDVSAGLGGGEIGKAGAAGVRGATSGFTSGLLSGKGLGGAAEQAGISGLASGLYTGARSALGADTGGAPSTGEQIASGAGQSLLQQYLFSPQTQATTVGTGAAAPQTTAGGQALQAAPDLGYGGPGATIFGGEDKDKPSQKVWNVASLRYKDETGA
jgi:hypothetical protein